jgi:hypothetical protein
MQDRYVGDAGDFAKYSLLSALGSGDPALRIGVLWYLFPNEAHNQDGRHIGYLADVALAKRDPRIHGKLKTLVTSNQRSVDAVVRAGVLPGCTIFYDAPLVMLGKPAERLSRRSAWFNDGLERLRDADIVFFDPDNGLESPALAKSSPRAGKYVLWSEIEEAWRAGHSLVIYNHLHRRTPAAAQTRYLAEEFQRRLPEATILPLLFRRGSCRHLWVIAQQRHADCLAARVQSFLDRGWRKDTDFEP